MERTLRARHDLHLLRKAWHMTTGGIGLIAFLSMGLDQHLTGLILVCFALTGFAFEFLRLRLDALNQRVLAIMGPLMRTSERQSCSGLPFYALGTGACLMLFEREVALLSVLFLIFADPISSLFGILYGQRRLIPGKSLEGTMAGFITCYLLTLLMINATLDVSGFSVIVFCFFGGCIGAIGELLSFIADDNLTIPLFSGFGLTLLNAAIPLF